ncbi:hypothetical protein, partial [Nostoc sp.]|uniref:hypothetical protein n=1 Tax=Nostoc sp. TaxID=1180 RepID=UPI002FFB6223
SYIIFYNDVSTNLHSNFFFIPRFTERIPKSLVQKLVKQQRLEGNLQSKPRGKRQFSHLTNTDIELRELVESSPDATPDRVV